MKPFSQPSTLKVSHTDPNATHLISNRLAELLPHQEEPIVIVCVGTDRSTGDALGPLVGTALQKHGSPYYELLGTLEEPVHAMNLAETIQSLNSRYTRPFVIGIDACLGQVSSIGSIQISPGPLHPGAGVNKTLPPIGDMHITGIVNVGGFMEYFVLQNTRLSLVMQMADLIASSLHEAVAFVKRRPSIASLQPD